MDMMIPEQMAVPALVDELGQVRAAIANLEAQEKALKEALIAELGPAGVAEGALFRVTISATERAVVAWKAIAEKLGATRQMIAGNTSHTGVVTVKTVSRNGKGV